MAPTGWLLFDWGDTLMRVFPEYSGPMYDWPRVEAMPGAAEALAVLREGWGLALATNSTDSSEAEIWMALGRVGLDTYLDRVYCYRRIGSLKPAPRFFKVILADLEVDPSQVVMVGDNFEIDVLGANRSGLRAVWLNDHSNEDRIGKIYRTVHSLQELPALLMEF